MSADAACSSCGLVDAIDAARRPENAGIPLVIRLLAGTYVVPHETPLLLDSSLTVSSLSLVGEPGAVLTAPRDATEAAHERRMRQTAPPGDDEPDEAALRGRAMSHRGATGRTSDWLEASGSPLVTISSNVQPVALEGLTFQGASRGPAIAAEATRSLDERGASSLLPVISISRCSFVNNSHAGALQMLRVAVDVDASVFQSNSAPESNGGAINVQQGSLALRYSLVEGNVALRGGGLHVSGNSSVVVITGSTLQLNHAVDVGGAIATSDGALVLMRNGTALRRNSAPTGQSIDHWGSVMAYQLPVPAGSWLASTVRCRNNVDGDAPLCAGLLTVSSTTTPTTSRSAFLDRTVGALYFASGQLDAHLAIIPVGDSMNHDYPLACGAGFFGESWELLGGCRQGSMGNEWSASGG